MTEILKIYRNEKEFDYMVGTSDMYGNFYATDRYNHKVMVRSWADAMNYLNSFNRNGDRYYDTWEEAVESWNEDLPDEDKKTVEDVKKSLSDDLIAEACGGRIEITEDEDDE